MRASQKNGEPPAAYYNRATSITYRKLLVALSGMLKRDLSWVWIAIATMVGLLIWLLLQLGMQGMQARVATARTRAGMICQIMRAGGARLDLQGTPGEATGRAVIDMALREDSGVEGGLWTAARGARRACLRLSDLRWQWHQERCASRGVAPHRRAGAAKRGQRRSCH